MKHTPGPWIVVTNKVMHGKSLDVFAQPRQITRDMPYNSEEDAANARLIAAAPELLAAAHELSKLFAKAAKALAPPPDIEAMTARLNAAIAKAEGGK